MNTRWYVLIALILMEIIGFILIAREDKGCWGSGLDFALFFTATVPALIVTTILMVVL